MDIIQPEGNLINEEKSRAKEIDRGTLPLSMENVLLGLPTKPGINFDDRSSVSAIKWSFDQLVGQKQLLQTINITPATSSTTPIVIIRHTWESILKRHFRNLRDLFFVKSWKWKLLFEFRSNFQQVGMISIIYCNCPMDALPFITGKPITYIDQKTYVTDHPLYKPDAFWQLPHTNVMMGEDQDVCCTLNWVSPFKGAFREIDYWGNRVIGRGTYYAPPNPMGYDMGFIYVMVPVPMQVATGVSNNQLTMRIWSQLTDIEYAGYDPTDDII